MGSFGGYFKGEKKKGKKDKKPSTVLGNSPVFTMPEIISKKKKDY